jgi:hypothetical protein
MTPTDTITGFENVGNVFEMFRRSLSGGTCFFRVQAVA